MATESEILAAEEIEWLRAKALAGSDLAGTVGAILKCREMDVEPAEALWGALFRDLKAWQTT